jgi:hypothetical protein
MPHAILIHKSEIRLNPFSPIFTCRTPRVFVLPFPQRKGRRLVAKFTARAGLNPIHTKSPLATSLKLPSKQENSPLSPPHPPYTKPAASA